MYRTLKGILCLVAVHHLEGSWVLLIGSGAYFLLELSFCLLCATSPVR